MKLTAKYQPERDQYWSEVERFFGDLPPGLFRQAVLLKNNLATFYSDTGQFKDILRREQDQPLPFVTIIVNDNPADGLTTDIDGRFRIQHPQSIRSLTFSYVGYARKRVQVDNADPGAPIDVPGCVPGV